MNDAAAGADPRLTTAKTGRPSLIHQGICLHSTYDPEKEADTWARSQSTDAEQGPDVLWVIFGCGLGYHLQSLCTAGAKEIIAFEPLAPLSTLRRQAGVLPALLEAQVTDSLCALQKAFRQRYPGASATRIVALPAYAKLFPEQFEQFKAELNGDVRELKDALYTQLTLSGRWTRQVFDNLPEVVRNPSIFSLQGFARGWPAVVISPGPSLEKALDALADLRGRCLMLCTSPALRALTRRGIHPHFVLVADHQDLAYHFRDCPPESYQHQILLSKCHAAVIALPVTRRFFHGEPTDTLTQQIFSLRGEKPFVLEDGYSVSTLAFKLALFMNADPVILTGQDLAFAGEKMYADSAVDGGRALEYLPGGTQVSLHKVKTGSAEALANPGAVRPISLFWVPGQQGQPLPTYQSYQTMHHWFERQAEEHAGQCRLINASEGGALIRGMEHLSPKEVAAQLSAKPSIDFSGRLQDIPPVDEAMLRAVRQGLSSKVLAYGELGELAQRCEALVGRCLENPGDAQRLQTLLQAQRQVTAGLDAHSEIELWLQEKLLEHHRLVVSAEDPIRADLERSLHLFRAVREASCEMAPLLEKAVSRLQGGSPAPALEEKARR